MFFFTVQHNIHAVSENAIHVRDAFNQFPLEMEYDNDLYIYGTIHNGAAVYYRESWFRTGVV